MFNRKQTIVQIQQQAKGKWETRSLFSTRIPTVAYHNLTTEAVEAAKRAEYGMLRAVGYEEGNSEELQKFHLGDESCLIAFAICFAAALALSPVTSQQEVYFKES
jgi:hypothetical protein